MRKRSGFGGLGVGMLVVLGMLSASVVQAQIVYPRQTFTFDTSALSGFVGPFQLDFQLTDGSGTGDGNTSLTVDNFVIDGASAPGIAAASLTDSAFFTEVMRDFTPGGTLRFDLSGSYGVDTDPTTGTVTPDEFSFAILKGDGTEVSTTAPSGALLLVDFDNISPAAMTTRTFQIVPAQAVPEPDALVLLAAGLPPLIMAMRRRRKEMPPR